MHDEIMQSYLAFTNVHLEHVARNSRRNEHIPKIEQPIDVGLIFGRIALEPCRACTNILFPVWKFFSPSLRPTLSRTKTDTFANTNAVVASIQSRTIVRHEVVSISVAYSTDVANPDMIISSLVLNCCMKHSESVTLGDKRVGCLSSRIVTTALMLGATPHIATRNPYLKPKITTGQARADLIARAVEGELLLFAMMQETNEV